ncbi:hypothetical protein, partial [Gemmatimonas sp.]|uniref:hypothetical protein n=1 Tax=Gemmatimonas sp. TaxID=1962908 RepID=UPI0037C10689
MLAAACARNTTSTANPTPAPATGTAPVVAGDLAIIPVRVTYVLRTLAPSLDSLFPVSDSLGAARCAAIG